MSYQWTIWALLLCLVYETDGKFGGGARGGFGRGGGSFGRGSSAARGSSIFGGGRSSSSFSKSYGGSFRSSSGAGTNNFRTRTIGGSSYYVPMSGIRSRNTFRSSFMGSMMGYMVGRSIMHSAMSPMRVNSYDYYFGRRYYSGPRDRQLCSANVNQIDSNNVPFDTTVHVNSNTNLTEQWEMEKIAEELDNSTETLDSTPTSNEIKFSDIRFKDGSQPPQEIVWSCPNVQDRCCYMECCPLSDGDDYGDRQIVGYALIGLFVMILIALWANNRRTQQGGPIRRW